MTRNPLGPGIRKTRSFPLLTRRTVQLWQSSDYRVREMFESADVMSEGACKQEKTGKVYYGMTSIVLPLQSVGGSIPDDELSQVVRILEFDPHARVRAIRIACREAQVRAAVSLGQLRAELAFSGCNRGVKISVDVEAAERAALNETSNPHESRYGTS